MRKINIVNFSIILISFTLAIVAIGGCTNEVKSNKPIIIGESPFIEIDSVVYDHNNDNTLTIKGTKNEIDQIETYVLDPNGDVFNRMPFEDESDGQFTLIHKGAISMVGNPIKGIYHLRINAKKRSSDDIGVFFGSKTEIDISIDLQNNRVQSIKYESLKR